MTDHPRLIEAAFPLKQASLDSVHEKNVRHGHISTLHIWPARRPLAACRAALIATLLPDPGSPEERREMLERLAGKVVQVTKKKRMPNGRVEETLVEETVGGILHWGRESGPDLDWFRQKIREAYGGRPPRVLDPFAGGGAIPLEAMRLGCEAAASDINPVAWFILKCTLEYPQKLAGQARPLPGFALESPEFMAAFVKGKGNGKRQTTRVVGEEQHVQTHLFHTPPEADLAWHVRAWGWWVLERARADLGRFYPTVEGKPTVAYLWARTVTCKNCRATVPLLKTRWLCKKDRKRVLLTMVPNSEKTAVEFGVQADVPVVGANAAQRREHDRGIGAGTMSRSGATCPCCGTIMTMEDIRLEGRAARLGSVMTAVVVDGAKGKEYRLPTDDDIRLPSEAERELERVFADIPFGLPEEPLATKEALGFRVPLYGFDRWRKLFTPRQLLALGTFVKYTREARAAMVEQGYAATWCEALVGYAALIFDRSAAMSSMLCTSMLASASVRGTFARWALPITWDFVETNLLGTFGSGYQGAVESVALSCKSCCDAATRAAPVSVSQRSATRLERSGVVDVLLTDPPYYDAIPYSDLMDFFYVWLRRTVDPEVLVGKPAVKGTRLAVEFIVELLAEGWSEADILKNYPGLAREDILACLAYASARLQAEKVYPLKVG